MSIEEELGKIGQDKAKKLLLKYFRASFIFQVDWISLEYGNYIINEVKNQEPFEPPPFKGQGLPIWQVKSRITFYKDMGIRCRLIIFNPLETTEVLWQWLDILEKGQHYDTHGEKSRRVYPVKNFYKIDMAKSKIAEVQQEIF